MSDFDEKMDQAETGSRSATTIQRAQCKLEPHLSRYAGGKVPYVGEAEPRPTLEVLAVRECQGAAAEKGGSAPGHGQPVLYALHLMPRVSLWAWVSGLKEADQVFEHVCALDAEWDAHARAWRIVGINVGESRSWLELTPRRFNLGQLEGQHHDEHPKEEDHPTQPIPWPEKPRPSAELTPRRRRGPGPVSRR